MKGITKKWSLACSRRSAFKQFLPRRNAVAAIKALQTTRAIEISLDKEAHILELNLGAFQIALQGRAYKLNIGVSSQTLGCKRRITWNVQSGGTTDAADSRRMYQSLGNLKLLIRLA
jgi:hypothetical protein